MGCENVESCLRAMGGFSRYQVLQVIVINLGVWGASIQLLDNIFIGRKVTHHQCTAPDLHSRIPNHLRNIPWNSSHVAYGPCEISVSRDDHTDTYPCLFGQTYDYRRELSFRTEFDLVCSRSLLADFLQTLVIMGQGCGAVIASFLSDKYGRKRVLVWSQFGLLLVGMMIGMAPSYMLLAFLKFFVGCLQQGVVTGKATMSIELFPPEYRSATSLVMAAMWLLGSCGMAFVSYMMVDYSWRALQCTLSAVSFVAFVQLCYLDESLRWLVANGRKQAAIRVVKRAAHTNGLVPADIINTLYSDRTGTGYDDHASNLELSSTEEVRKRTRLLEEEEEEGWEMLDPSEITDDTSLLEKSQATSASKTSKEGQPAKLSIFDMFRHKRLLFITCVVWLTWCTCAFSTFTLYVMSTSLSGNRFLNYFLTALMELPACFLFYFAVDKWGRKPVLRLFFLLCGIGLMGSGFCRVFEDNPFFATASVIMAMLGMLGASGMFGGLFFYTPELYPTNIRQQALGIASLAGRFGGMIAPFMMPLSEIIVWAPGAITGSMCFLVIFLFHFLPETKGRELPRSLDDIDSWNQKSPEKLSCTVTPHCQGGHYVRKCTRLMKKVYRFLNLDMVDSSVADDCKSNV